MALFAIGVLMVHIYSTLLYLWGLAGVSADYPLLRDGAMAGVSAYSPPVGMLLMIVGGLVMGRSSSGEVAR